MAEQVRKIVPGFELDDNVVVIDGLVLRKEFFFRSSNAFPYLTRVVRERAEACPTLRDGLLDFVEDVEQAYEQWELRERDKMPVDERDQLLAKSLEKRGRRIKRKHQITRGVCRRCGHSETAIVAFRWLCQD